MQKRHRFYPAAVVLMALSGCAHRSDVRPATQTAFPSGPVAAVWFDVGYPPAGFDGEMNRLIVGVWGDGRIIWSDDRARGGKPYRMGRVDPDRVRKLLADLQSAGLFQEPREVNFGPDASYTVVAAGSGEQRKWLGSWHEPKPTNLGTVIDQRGIHHVNPGEARPEPSPDYTHFLGVWDRSRKLIEGMVPPSGEPLETVDPAVFKLGRKPR